MASTRRRCNYPNCQSHGKYDLRPCPGCQSVLYDSVDCMERDIEHLKICDLLRQESQKYSRGDSKNSGGRYSNEKSLIKKGMYKINFGKPLGRGAFGKVKSNIIF